MIYTELTACAALLHDVAKDTPVTLEELEREFPREVTDALRLLTHAPDVDYLDYVRALAQNPIARAVKLSDLRHNSDEPRMLGRGDEAALAGRRAKCSRALAILTEQA